MPAFLGVGLVDADDVGVNDVGLEFLDILSHRLTGDGERLAVHEALVEQGSHDGGDAARAVQVFDVLRPGGRKLTDIGRLAADVVEDVQ